MKKIFDYDGPILSFFGKLADLMILNFLIMIFSLPIITMGASFTAGHFVALKIKRGEGAILRNFWKSFKENFKQATFFWIFVLLQAGVIFLALKCITGEGTFLTIVKGIIIMGGVFTAFMAMWFFPLLSKFYNPMKVTLGLSFMFSMKYLWKTIYMLICILLPVVLILASTKTAPAIVLLGNSVPLFLCTLMYDKLFADMEAEVWERQRKEEEEQEGQEEEEKNEIELQ